MAPIWIFVKAGPRLFATDFVRNKSGRTHHFFKGMAPASGQENQFSLGSVACTAGWSWNLSALPKGCSQGPRRGWLPIAIARYEGL